MLKDGGKTVPTYQPKSKEDELYRKQMYADSLDLYKFSQLKHKLEPVGSELGKESFKDLFSNYINNDEQKIKDSILFKKAEEIIDIRDNIIKKNKDISTMIDTTKFLGFNENIDMSRIDDINSKSIPVLKMKLNKK